jgi:subtilisin-like proprotein convertase family protein
MKLSSALITAIAALITTSASAQEVFSSGPINVPISDGVTTSHTIFGGDFDRYLADVNVRLNLTHTFDSDLDIVLVAPNSFGYVHLCSDVGGAGQNMLGTIFDDQATNSILAAVAPMTGNFRPEGGPIDWAGSVALPSTALANLAALNGTDSFGDWTLYIYDDAGQDVGVLQEWAVIMSYLPSINPQVSLRILPSQFAPGGSGVVEARVTPGANPASTSYSFVSFLSEPNTGTIGSFRDDGVFPDVHPGDLTYTASINIPLSAPSGLWDLIVNVIDQASRLATGVDAFEILPNPQGACCVGGNCVIMAQYDCLAAGGSFSGAGTTCQNEEYTFSSAGGPFEDISGTGIIGPTGDDSVVNVPIGFDFPFYGNTYSNLFISSNGLVSFGSGSNEWINTPIPSLAAPNNAIYALWDDFNPEAGGHVYYRSLGSGPSQRFIVQWDRIPQFNTNDSNTFQLVLYPTGRIDFRYGAISAFTNADATIGVENVLGTVAISIPASSIFTGTNRTTSYIPRTCPSPCLWHADGCFADYTNDGGIDGDDVIAFFADWDNGNPCADADLSGGTDGDDVIAFFGSWDTSGAGSPGC